LHGEVGLHLIYSPLNYMHDTTAQIPKDMLVTAPYKWVLLKLFLDHILCIYLMSAVTILVLTNVDTHAAHRYVNAQKEAVYILF